MAVRPEQKEESEGEESVEEKEDGEMRAEVVGERIRAEREE